MSDLWLLALLLQTLAWPSGANDKLVTLSRNRKPTAHLLGGVAQVHESGVRDEALVRRGSVVGVVMASTDHADDDVWRPSIALVPKGATSVAGDDTLAGMVADIFKADLSRNKVLIVWRQLQATLSDSMWMQLIDDAHAQALDLNFPTPEGETFLHVAVRRGYTGSVKKLLDAGIDPNLRVTARGRDHGNTALHAAVTDVSTETAAQRDLVKMLVTNPATDVCVWNGSGQYVWSCVGCSTAALLLLT